MSCRVFQRKLALFDQLIDRLQKKKISKLIGYYFPTIKNKLVKNLFENLGFSLLNEESNGSSTWEFNVCIDYAKKNTYIRMQK